MSAQFRPEPPAHHSYTVTGYDRGRGVGHSALTSMTGPEFTSVGAVYAPLNALPVAPRLIVLAVLVVIGMGGCTAAWVDYKHDTPSVDVCRSVTSGVPPEPVGSCIPREQLPQVVAR